MEREFILSIVPSYKEQFLCLCRSRLLVCSYVYSTHLRLFIFFFKSMKLSLVFFLMNAIFNAIKLCGIMQVLEIIKRLSFIATMYVYTA